MINLALAAVLLVALGAILFGVRYMRRDAYLPYHAAVAGKPFVDLDPGVQAVILGMLRIIGGCALRFTTEQDGRLGRSCRFRRRRSVRCYTSLSGCAHSVPRRKRRYGRPSP